MATLIMNEMVKRGFRIGLITWDRREATPHYDLDPEIQWVQLDLGHPDVRASWRTLLKRQLRLRRITKLFRPNVAIGFQVGAFAAMRTATMGLGIPTIAAERNSRDLFRYISSGKSALRRANAVLRAADCVTLQFESYRSSYAAGMQKRIAVIPNPVAHYEETPYPNELADPPQRILNVGRLSMQKNQHFLIRSFALIAPLNPEWQLTLVGDGEMRDSVQNTINETGMTGRVQLVGVTKNVEYWYERSAIFAFPSLWEGFPNALAEAMRAGLPAVGLEQTAGVNELVRHGENGLLTSQSEVAFSQALQTLIHDIKLRQRAGRIANAKIKRFKPETIFDQWEHLFKMVANKKK